MSNYGVTPTGVLVKRLDEIMEEMHDDLSAGWGVNTRLNPQSYLNVQLTAFADKLAELWEFGEQVYQSMYPYSAESASLDNAVQFGGISREEARPTFYPIHAECVDGTTIPRGFADDADGQFHESGDRVIELIQSDGVVSGGSRSDAELLVELNGHEKFPLGCV